MLEYEELKTLADRVMLENSTKGYSDLGKVARQDQTPVGLRKVI